jgi:hypothetical protein
MIHVFFYFFECELNDDLMAIVSFEEKHWKRPAIMKPWVSHFKSIESCLSCHLSRVRLLSATLELWAAESRRWKSLDAARSLDILDQPSGISLGKMEVLMGKP